MMHDEGHAEDIGKAVLIAALSAVATGLVAWAIDKVREKVDPKEKKDEPV